MTEDETARTELAPDPGLAQDPGDFVRQLRDLRVWSGNPSFARLQRLTGIPRSTLADALNPRRRTVPPLDTVRALVAACSGTSGDVARWEAAWRRLQASSAGGRGDDEPVVVIPRQLPAEVPGFAGRTAEVAELDALLAEHLTGGDGAPVVAVISGGPGIGKTAMAVRWAHRVAGHFPDGQLFVNLRGYDMSRPLTAAEALSALLRGLGVTGRELPTDTEVLAGLYRSATSERRLLTVLDNADSAEQVRQLLPGGAGCLTVVTSRDRLSGLVARDGARRLVLDVLTPDEARQLLATVLGADRVATQQAAADEVGRLCAYVPLALRIAAANVADRPGLSLDELAAMLRSDDRLATLAVDGDQRSAVRAAFDLSYQGLSPDARQLFRRFGLVPVPDLAPPTAATLIGSDEQRAGRLLDELAAGHLVDPVGGGRFGCHDLLRLYARDRAHLEDTEADRQAALRRLFDFYVQTAKNAADALHPTLLRLPRPAPVEDVRPLVFARVEDALHWLERERPNLVAIVGHTDRHGPLEVSWQLVDALRGFMFLRWGGAEWLAIAQAGLAAARRAGDRRVEAAMLMCSGMAHSIQRSYPQAVDLLGQAAAISRERGDRYQEAGILGNLGAVHLEFGRLDQAAEALERTVELFTELGYPERLAPALGNLGMVSRYRGRLREASEQLSRSVELSRQLGDQHRAAIALAHLGLVYLDLGDLDLAERYAREALALQERFGDQFGAAKRLTALAQIADARRQRAKALRHARRALAIIDRLGDRHAKCRVLLVLSEITLGRDAALALRYASDALGLARAIENRFGEAWALIRSADAHRVLGDHDEADELVEQALAIARDSGYRVLEGHALTVLAEIQLAAGRAGCAAQAGRQAADVHRLTGHRLGLARTLLTLGEATAAVDGDAAARPHWSEAFRTFADVGSGDADVAKALLAGERG